MTIYIFTRTFIYNRIKSFNTLNNITSPHKKKLIKTHIILQNWTLERTHIQTSELLQTQKLLTIGAYVINNITALTKYYLRHFHNLSEAHIRKLFKNQPFFPA